MGAVLEKNAPALTGFSTFLDIRRGVIARDFVRYDKRTTILIVA